MTVLSSYSRDVWALNLKDKKTKNPDFHIMVEYEPNRAVNLEAAKTLGLITPDEYRKLIP